jgi:hypothetical protein
MKYSLRSLMVGITLACVVLGSWAARVEYLRRMAVFHENEWTQRVNRLAKNESIPRDAAVQLMEHIAEGDCTLEQALNFSMTIGKNAALDSEWQAALSHHRLGASYRQAIQRPWTSVDESAGLAAKP